MSQPRRRPSGLAVSPALTIAALGVVFGDIGTSPLYALGTCFEIAHVRPTPADVLGIVSLVIWALVVVVCVKYVGIVMKIDSDGEGGILALLALVAPGKVKGVPAKATWLTIVVVIGTGMLFGDGAITPAISVVSAIEGLNVATTSAQPFIVPISIVILIGLFALQSRGTERVGALFGPVMVLWFVAIGALGAVALVREPQGLWALDPRHAFGFLTDHGIFGFLVFGGVVLAVTGVEALYADLSHFGRRPIFLAWYAVVFPALVLNYLGQGAVTLAEHRIPASPFYALAPGALLLPLVALATFATVIASQALISGVFTLSEQAINLSLLPRMRILHTSAKVVGQVYVPLMNGIFGVACVILVLLFRSSSALAGAYGLAVSTTMLATSILFYVVVTRVFHWHKRVALPIVIGFVLVDGTFVAAGLPKVFEGAWVPFAICAVFVTTTLTWLEGRRCMAKSMANVQMPIEDYLSEVAGSTGPPAGTMIFLTGDPTRVPFVDPKHPWVGAHARDGHLVLLTLAPTRRPYVDDAARVSIQTYCDRLTVVRGTFGFMERPSIKPILAACRAADLRLDSADTPFFYADPKIVRAPENPLPLWVRKYFEFLNHNAFPLSDDLRIPPERRVELGVEVAI